MSLIRPIPDKIALCQDSGVTEGVNQPDDGLAGQALLLVTADPGRAWALGVEARQQARREDDPGAQSAAERALGLAARELHDARAALRHLRRAVNVAAAAQLTERAAEARMSLALVLAEAGRPIQALREIDTAAPALRGLPAARLQMQRALILDRLNRFSEAMDGYTAALADFRRGGDRLWQARALTNRGVLHTYQGSLRQAEADLRAAEHLYAELDQELAVAQVRHNLGFVLARAGDVPGALRWYDLADEYFARTTRPAIALMDRGELFLQARLLPEARATAEAALYAAKTSKMRLFEAQARLMLAEAALAGGDHATARTEAGAAHRAFVRQGRPAWAALARYIGLRAIDAPGPTHLRRAREVAADLTASGWWAHALDARLYVAGLLLHRASSAGTGRLRSAFAPTASPEAAEELRRIRAAGRRGPAELRARAWHAEALLRDAAGDQAGARRALLAGTRVLQHYRAALGATELRTLAAGYATDLAATGLRLAARGGRARSILWWGELWKAAALRLPPTRPPHEQELAADLADLRRLAAATEQAVGGPGRGSARLREQRALEERIRRRSWHASGAAAGTAGTALLESLAGRLGDRTLVELLDIDGSLWAVVVSARGIQSRQMGPVAETTAELDALRFALRRIVLEHGRPAARTSAAGGVRHAAQRLDDLIFEPVRPWLGGGELVLVPVGALHALPWALLPTCRGRPVAVSPSASAWLTATNAAAQHAGRQVLVAGPGLAHAESEVLSVAQVLTAAGTMVGAEATTGAVLKALDGASLAHIAAHGEFRADNPMFSHLRMADGPLTVYDLERLVRPPSTVVFSACNLGQSAVRPGEELMGLTAALLGLGTATVLGSVLPAQDAAARQLMVDLHQRLATGTGPAAALAAAQAAMGDGLDEWTATAAAFVCFGAG